MPGRSSARRLGELIPNTPIGAAINAAHANTVVDPCIDSEVEEYANRPEVGFVSGPQSIPYLTLVLEQD